MIVVASLVAVTFLVALIGICVYYAPIMDKLIFMGYYNSLVVDKEELFLSEKSVWEDSQNGYLLEVHDENPYNDSCITITRTGTGEKIAVQFERPGIIKFRYYDSKKYNDYEMDRSCLILYADWEYNVEESIFLIYIGDVEKIEYSYLENSVLSFQRCIEN